jgi:hypothetical protein
MALILMLLASPLIFRGITQTFQQTWSAHQLGLAKRPLCTICWKRIIDSAPPSQFKELCYFKPITVVDTKPSSRKACSDVIRGGNRSSEKIKLPQYLGALTHNEPGLGWDRTCRAAGGLS